MVVLFLAIGAALLAAGHATAGAQPAGAARMFHWLAFVAFLVAVVWQGALLAVAAAT